MRKYLSRNDCILIGFIVVISLLTVFLFSCVAKNGDTVCVYVNNILYGEYPLSEDADVIVNSSNSGTNRLIIRNGCANISEANCKNQLCVNQRAISMDGETIVCLPNKVVCIVKADDKGEYDGVSE